MKQKTISKSISWQGTGLHTGEKSTVTLEPAEANFGRKIRRTDVDNGPWIPCDVRYVHSTKRSTDLQHKGVEIKTVEHLLSALYALGVDNAMISVQGPELPILDGSSNQFARDIMEVGLVEQDTDAKQFSLTEFVHFKDEESGAEYMAYPGEGLSAEVIVDYDSELIGDRHASYNGKNNYLEDIAPARTYVFTHEITELADQGLIKGGDLSNAIVLKSQHVDDEKLKSALQKLDKEDIPSILQQIETGLDLKFANEPARHKLLDLLGDLALIGVGLDAKIIAKKPGHSGNIAFARLIKSLYQKDVKLKGKPDYDPNVEPIYTIEDIQGFLPHRYPFLLVDKIIELSEKKVVGVKNITFNESFFQGHFPNNSVFPGVLQMEALAQTGGILALNNVDNPSNWDTYFLKMDNVKFKRKVVPGDTLILKMELLSPIRRGVVHMQGTAYVGDAIVSEGELTAQIVDRTTL